MGGSEFGGSNFVIVDRGNDESVSFDDAMALLGEIERLRSELARSEARQAELEMLAHRDPLVDLPNRRSFLSSLENVIARVERYGGPAALLLGAALTTAALPADTPTATRDRIRSGKLTMWMAKTPSR